MLSRSASTGRGARVFARSRRNPVVVTSHAACFMTCLLAGTHGARKARAPSMHRHTVAVAHLLEMAAPFLPRQ